VPDFLLGFNLSQFAATTRAIISIPPSLFCVQEEVKCNMQSALVKTAIKKGGTLIASAFE